MIHQSRLVLLLVWVACSSLMAGPMRVKDAKSGVECTVTGIAPKLVIFPDYCFADGEEIEFTEARYCIGDPTICPGVIKTYKMTVYSKVDTSKEKVKLAFGILDSDLPSGWEYTLGGKVMEGMKFVVHRVKKETQHKVYPDGTEEDIERSVFDKKDSETVGYKHNLFYGNSVTMAKEDVGVPAVAMYDGKPVLIGIGVAQSPDKDYYLRLDRKSEKALIKTFKKLHNL